MDQRICIKFCVKNKIKCVGAFRMLTVAYGEATLDRSNVYRWYKMFSEGREDVKDEERAGRPSTSTTDENIDEVKKIVFSNLFYGQSERSIRNIICKLYAICAKQSARNAQICGRTKIGFCTMITPLLVACARIFDQKQHTNDAAATVFPRSGPL